MKKYRTICVESDNEELLNIQLGKSLATGVHSLCGVKVHVGEWEDEDPQYSQYFENLIDLKETVGAVGPITQQYVDKWLVQNEENK